MTTEIHHHSKGLIRLFTAYRNAGMPLSEAFDRLRLVYRKRQWSFHFFDNDYWFTAGGVVWHG